MSCAALIQVFELEKSPWQSTWNVRTPPLRGFNSEALNVGPEVLEQAARVSTDSASERWSLFTIVT
ncbi:hypothetical protein WM31_00965 [Burkholderia ubonensis]|nr:hypothetical protein WM31_00965 [Burkholderia ubonensis]